MEFRDWLSEQLSENDWTQAELARRANLTRATVSNYINGRIPDEAALRKIARALKLPPATVFEKAGLLPPKPPKEELIEKILYELDHLPKNEQEDILQYIQLRRQITEERGKYNAAKKASNQEEPAKP